MNVHFDLNTAKFSHTVVTVGTFDGLHLGHKFIIDELLVQARTLRAESVVLTFWPHPGKVLSRSGRPIELLQTLDEKINIFKETGIDHLVVYPFTPEFASLSSCDFIEQILHPKLSAARLVVGYDHRFGKDRQGDINVLNSCTAPLGFSVVKAEVLTMEAVNISSTKIRKALKSGNLKKANHFLGYNYYLGGEVTDGNKIGRTLNYRTANIKVAEDKLLPKFGVYAVHVWVEEKKYFGMLNIGLRPTVTGDVQPTPEVHIFDFNKQLYGKYIKLSLVEYIRTEKRFANSTALRNQLIQDERTVREVLNL
ncbi:MAG: bifunctional riboflavin kinase/FAD synthetase [Bacteroidota bacterium]|nr:bifunctional riboflavin kinase/FAD synthetase [Bacteroidota bacterium]